MDPREAKAIMSQGAIRPETARAAFAATRAILAELGISGAVAPAAVPALQPARTVAPCSL